MPNFLGHFTVHMERNRDGTSQEKSNPEQNGGYMAQAILRRVILERTLDWTGLLFVHKTEMS